MKRTRANKAGRKMARAIIEMVNLMYQSNTAINFLEGIHTVLADESIQRKIDRAKERSLKKRLKAYRDRNTL